jgi:iron-sulfur cluster assembly protein
MNDTVEIRNELTLSDKAAQQILELRTSNDIPDSHALRIGVKGGGCSGLTYSLGFDMEQRDNDVLFEIKGVRLVIDPKSLFYLTGTELDYSDGLTGKGFVFNNPNAVRTCGCGSSFGV